MATTNTDNTWYYYIRKKGRKGYLGLVNENGAATSQALTLNIYYDEMPDNVTNQDTILPIPPQFELGFLKGVVAELMAMSDKENLDMVKKRDFDREYRETIADAIEFQTEQSEQPLVLKPFDLRDDDSIGRYR